MCTILWWGHNWRTLSSNGYMWWMQSLQFNVSVGLRHWYFVASGRWYICRIWAFTYFAAFLWIALHLNCIPQLENCLNSHKIHDNESSKLFGTTIVQFNFCLRFKTGWFLKVEKAKNFISCEFNLTVCAYSDPTLQERPRFPLFLLCDLSTILWPHSLLPPGSVRSHLIYSVSLCMPTKNANKNNPGSSREWPPLGIHRKTRGGKPAPVNQVYLNIFSFEYLSSSTEWKCIAIYNMYKLRDQHIHMNIVIG